MKNLNNNSINLKENKMKTENNQASTSKNNSSKKNLFFEMIIEGIEKLTSEQWEHYLKSNLDWFPKNAVSKKTYTRFNRFILLLDMTINNYESAYYATFKQISDAGGLLKKGSKSTVIQFFDFMVKHKETKKNITMSQYNNLTKEEKSKYIVTPFLKYFRVFNISLIENLNDIDFSKLSDDENIEIETLEDNEEIEILIQTLIDDKDLILKNDKVYNAFYQPLGDKIVMPLKDAFKSESHYYGTFFHELIHWTGNEKRLERFKTFEKPSKKNYAFEELIAEMGALLLSFDFNIEEGFQNSLIYLKGWCSFHQNKKVETLEKAFSESKKAVQFIYQ